jgi:endonuclease YncB( thermonuclease family)
MSKHTVTVKVTFVIDGSTIKKRKELAKDCLSLSGWSSGGNGTLVRKSVEISSIDPPIEKVKQ